MGAETVSHEQSGGFSGAVAGLTLADIVQLKALNRFSGCLAIDWRDQWGLIFFRDGEIIHAEQGERSGEDAFYCIMTWPQGSFTIRPKVTTTSLTIRQSWKYLLLEAHRRIDDLRREGKLDTAAVQGQSEKKSINERLRLVPGVRYAVLLKKDGTPVGDEGFSAERLAAQGFYLAHMGNRLGEILGFGAVRSAVAHSEAGNLLLYESSTHYLSILADAAVPTAEVESDVRKVLSSKSRG